MGCGLSRVMPDGSNLIFFMSGTSWPGSNLHAIVPATGSIVPHRGTNTGGKLRRYRLSRGRLVHIGLDGCHKPISAPFGRVDSTPMATPRGASHDLTTEADEVFIDTPAIAGRADGNRRGSHG